MKTCGEALVELLESFGIDTVFGIPGVHTVELYRGLDDTRIRPITPRHEQGAGFMADGYARASGRPAACFIITGPGMTNIATAMGQAFCDSIPMLVISSVNNTDELGLGGGRLHELPSQRSLVSGVCAFSHTLLRAQELPEVLARAFTVFRSARPRPVHIEVPIDIIVPAAEFTTTPPPIYTRPAPDPGMLEKATDLICEARRLLVMFRGGAVAARENAVDLVESVGAVAQELADLLGEARSAGKSSVIEIDESVALSWQW